MKANNGINNGSAVGRENNPVAANTVSALEQSETVLVDIDTLNRSDKLASLFPRQPEVIDGIRRDMNSNGFDAAHPIIVSSRDRTIIDGHCRYDIAKELRMKEVWVVEYEMDDEEMREYALHCQRDRRNLDDADILQAIEAIDTLKKPGPKGDGASLASSEAKPGKSAAETARKIGTSTTKVEKARTLLGSKDGKAIQAVKERKTTLNKAYKAVKEAVKAPRDTDTARANYKRILGYLDRAIGCCGDDHALIAELNTVKDNVNDKIAEEPTEVDA